MNVNFQELMLDFDENPIEHNGKPLTLGVVAATALNAPSDNHHNIAERGFLAIKVYNAEEIEITPEEATLIRSTLASAWSALIIARSFEFLK